MDIEQKNNLLSPRKSLNLSSNMVFRSISWAELCKLLCKEYNYTYESQNGSHIKIKHSSNKQIIIPAHKELKVGTFNAILSQIADHENLTKIDIYNKIFT